jgi:GGDEF domain-containing protein
MPPGLNALFFTSNDQGEMGSVETPPILRFLRPGTFALWFIIFCGELLTMSATGESLNWAILALSTALFAGVHIQFWYEESEQGRRFHYAIDRMRGRMYEDEATGLPNSRHFVFELRRQMMRSVRNGRGFSLVLTDLAGSDRIKREGDRILPALSKAIRHAVGDGDFVAHLQGPIFAAIVLDEHDRPAAAKSDAVLSAVGSCIPLDLAGNVFPVVSLTGYEGELEVRDFLRRAQRDLVGSRSHSGTPPAVTHRQRAHSAA